MTQFMECSVRQELHIIFIIFGSVEVREGIKKLLFTDMSVNCRGLGRILCPLKDKTKQHGPCLP